jgi:hypothetical protein
VSDRIEIRYAGETLVDRVFAAQGDFIRAETLARASNKEIVDWAETTELEIDGEPIRLWIKRESD